MLIGLPVGFPVPRDGYAQAPLAGDSPPPVTLSAQQLVAANTRIGVTEAQLFPQVALSRLAGTGGTVISGQS